MAVRTSVAALAVLIGLSVASLSPVQADPAAPNPGPTATSSDDELVDMVLDAIGHGGSESTATQQPPAPPG